jgi:DNA-binding CsgD family transcriptional regulator
MANCVNCGKQVTSPEAARCWWCNHKHRSTSALASLEVRAKEIQRLKDSGMTMVEISGKLGISRPRAYQILERVKK